MLLKETMETRGVWMLIDEKLWPDLDVLILESNNTQLPKTIIDVFSSIRTQERMEMTTLRKQAERFTCTTRILNNDVAA